MQQSCVGLDVHGKQSTFVIADEAGTVVAAGEVPTPPAGLKALRDRLALARGTGDPGDRNLGFDARR